MSDHITQWQTIIDAEIRASRRRISVSDLEDIRQDLYVAILEDRAADAAAVRKVCRRVLSGNTSVEPESLNDPKFLNAGLPVELFRDPEKLQKVRDAVDTLPEVERFVVREIFYEGSDAKAVAKKMGQTVLWVKKTQASALNKLHIQLIKENIECP